MTNFLVQKVISSSRTKFFIDVTVTLLTYRLTLFITMLIEFPVCHCIVLTYISNGYILKNFCPFEIIIIVNDNFSPNLLRAKQNPENSVSKIPTVA